MEESGIQVGEVELVGSQAWPIGAGGHSELMLGCFGQAESHEIQFDPEEMADVRWFTREQVKPLLEQSVAGNQGVGSADLVVPPPYAIAHHLIQHLSLTHI
eukprot:TRINITY_DN63016_c0_g1_i1.p1 TRINITY_DN63016_c0_g1~~TRINITY_DN63016_c0_g1_i1.p1  ORF type:complete len:101 (+),score=30.30 TRINITY_DN63016_c0_g1_i1:1-303(+)